MHGRLAAVHARHCDVLLEYTHLSMMVLTTVGARKFSSVHRMTHVLYTHTGQRHVRHTRS